MTPLASTRLCTVSLLLTLVGCSLGPDATFGALCFAASDCPGPYSCVDSQCISAGEGEGEGEGEQPLPTCGNATIDDTETCDDGNVRGGDGCSPQCGVESGYRCMTPGRCAALETSDPCPDDDGADLTGDCRADFAVAGTTVVAVFADKEVNGVRTWVSQVATVEATTALGQLRSEHLPGPNGRRAVLFGQPEQTRIVARSCVGEACTFSRDNDAFVVRQVVGFPDAFASLACTDSAEGGLAVALRDDLRVGNGHTGPATTSTFGLDLTDPVALPDGVTPTAIQVVPDRTNDGVADLVVVHADGLVVIDGLLLTVLATNTRPVRVAAPMRDGSLVVVNDDAVQLLDDAFNVLADITGAFSASAVAAVTSVRDASGDGIDDVLLGVPSQGAVYLVPSSGGAALVCSPTVAPESEFGASLRSLGVYEGAAAAVIGAPGASAVEMRTFTVVAGCETVVLGAKSIDAATAPRFGAQLAR